MEIAGGCHCGAIRYELSGDPIGVSLCHCSDCRKSAGAPAVSWAMFREDQFRQTQGSAKTHNSSGASMRSFCPECGTGLWFQNAQNLPDIVDIQSATLDDPEAFAPQAHIQTAERLNWMEIAHELPAFPRFPGMD